MQLVSTQLHPCVAILPFDSDSCKTTLASLSNRVENLGRPSQEETVGLAVAPEGSGQQLEVDPMSISYWETNWYSPSLRVIPKIVKFLGYLPYDISSMNLAERIVTMRRCIGLSREELAERLGVDESSLRHWEHRRRRPLKRNMDKLEVFFNPLLNG
jgi:DNA-binding XRE family transcriptional regulator